MADALEEQRERRSKWCEGYSRVLLSQQTDVPISKQFPLVQKLAPSDIISAGT